MLEESKNIVVKDVEDKKQSQKTTLKTTNKTSNNVKKSTTKTTKKLEIVEKYTYKSDEKVELITDKPSNPLNKIKKEDKSSIKNNEVNIDSMKNVHDKIKTNKELYESYIVDLKNFSLVVNGEVIYDSSIDKSKVSPVKFENDFFILYGRKYSYNGLRIQKINK